MTSQAIQMKNDYAAEFERLERAQAGGPGAWLLPVRKAAMARFGESGFPTTIDEAWRYTNVAPIANTRFVRPEGGAPHVTAESLMEYTLWDARAIRLVIVNGRLSPDLSRQGDLPEGVTVTPLAKAIAKRHPAAERHLGQYARHQTQSFAALNMALAQEGVLIHIPRGCIVETPIHLVFVSAPGREPIITYPRILIVAESRSQASIVETYVGFGDVYCIDAVTEIVAAEAAVLEHYRVQRESEAGFHVSTLQIQQDRGSNVKHHRIDFGGALVRNEINAVLAGEGADCTLNGLYMVAGTQHVDNHLRVEHVKPHCTSWEYFKGVLDGKSRAVFSGRIYVAKDAQKTVGKQSNLNLLLSEEALVDTKPQLEIFADDVKCTHGATIGQIDEDAVFYMRSRGISDEAARNLLVYAFAAESIGQIGLDALREQLQDLLFTRLPQGALLRFGRPYEYDREYSQSVRATDWRRHT